MTDARQKILDTIDANRDKAIKFLQQMVAIPSVTGDEGKIQAFLSDYLKKLGLEVDVWETAWEAIKKHPGYIPVDRDYEGRPNIVATLKGSAGNIKVPSRYWKPAISPKTICARNRASAATK